MHRHASIHKGTPAAHALSSAFARKLAQASTSPTTTSINTTTKYNKDHLQRRNACSSKEDQPAVGRLRPGQALHPAAPGFVATSRLGDAKANEPTMQAPGGAVARIWEVGALFLDVEKRRAEAKHGGAIVAVRREIVRTDCYLSRAA